MSTTKCLSFLSLSLAALVISVAAPSTSVSSGAPMAPQVRVFGGRTIAQRSDALSQKFDATLADLSEHLGQVRTGHELADLHAMNPAIRLRQLPGGSQTLVLVDAVTRGDPNVLRASLENLGLQNGAVYANDVGGWLPTSALRSAAALAELHSIRAAMPYTRTGAVTSQGDFAQGSQPLRAADPGLTGAGVTVGVLSNSFNCYSVYGAPNSGVPSAGSNGYAENGFAATYSTDISTGDLPSNVNVLAEADCQQFGAPIFLPDSDEGRAMLQIVHDVAPGAGLAFYTADNSEADFATGIGALASRAGATIEADDVGYPDEPYFQDGILAQAIDAVAAQGVAYFSAAGNDAANSYEIASPSFTTPGSGLQSGEMLMTFAGSGDASATSLPVQLPSLVPGDFVFIVLEWDQPYVTGAAGSPGASSQFDLCVSGQSGGDQVLNYNSVAPTTCTGLNALGSDANQILLVGNAANAAGNSQATTINISIGLAAGSPAPGRIKLDVADDGAGAVISATYATHSPTVHGHPSAMGAVAVGAAFFFDTPACGTSPPRREAFTSEGGEPILFDTSGNRLAAPVLRQKPEVVGPDGGNDTFLGQTLTHYGIAGGLLSTDIEQCQNNPDYPNFLGTSAATPHVASIAALMRQTNPGLTPTQIVNALETSAIEMDGSSPNFYDGYGFVQAGAALALLPPGPPTLSSSANTSTVGGSITLTWSSLNTSACTASGGWSGTLPTSGSQSVTTTTAGTTTYMLVCSNSVASASSSVMVSVSASGATALSPMHSGGGGAIDQLTLLGLIVVWWMRELGRRRGEILPRA